MKARGAVRSEGRCCLSHGKLVQSSEWHGSRGWTCLGCGWKRLSEVHISLLNSKSYSNLILWLNAGEWRLAFLVLRRRVCLICTNLEPCDAKRLVGDGGGGRGAPRGRACRNLKGQRVRWGLCSARELVLNLAKEVSSSGRGRRRVLGEVLKASKHAGDLALPAPCHLQLRASSCFPSFLVFCLFLGCPFHELAQFPLSKDHFS